MNVSIDNRLDSTILVTFQVDDRLKGNEKV